MPTNSNIQKVGLEFSAEGVADLKKQLSEVTSEINKSRAEFKLVQAQWDDNTKASDKLAAKQEYLQNVYLEQEKRVQIYRKELETLSAAEGDNTKAIEKKQTQLVNAESSLIKYGKELEETNAKINLGTANLEEFGKKLDSISDKTTKVGEGLSKNVTAPILAIGAAAIAAWKDTDEAYDSIITATGATGDEANKLADSFDAVYGNFPFESLQVADAIGEINTRFGFVDEALEKSSVSFLKFANINGIDVKTSIQLVSRAMGDAGIDASEYANVLDWLTSASQNSGIGIDKLTDSITKYGAPMRALGFDTKETIALFSQWEKAGVNTEIAFSGMKKAISNWGSEGKDARVEFAKTLEAIAAAPDIAKATTMAIETFGAKAGPDLADAIKGGRFAYQDFLNLIQNSSGIVENTFDATQDPLDESIIAWNNLKLALSDLGNVIQTMLGPVLQSLSVKLKELTAWFEGLSPQSQQSIVIIAGMIAALGPLIVIMGVLAGNISKIITLMTNENVVKVLSAAKTGIVTVAQFAWNAVMAAGTVIAGAFGAAIAFLTSPIGLVILAVVAITAAFVLFGDQIKEIMDNVFTKITEVFDKIKSFFEGSVFLGVFAGVIQNFENIGAAAKRIFEGIIDLVSGVFTGNWSKAWQGIKNIFGGIFDGLYSIAVSPLNLIIGALNGVISGINIVIKGINKIKIPDWDIFGDLAGKGLNLSTIGNISYLAKGGELLDGMSVVAEAGPELLMQQGNKTKVVPLSNGGGAVKNDLIDYSKMFAAFLKALNSCKIKIDKDGLIRIIDDRLLEVV